MILFFIFLAVVVLGIVMINIDWDSFIPFNWDGDNFKATGFLLIFIGAAAVVISLISFMCLHFDEIAEVNAYYKDKVLIELAYNNENLTGEERASVLSLITEDNIKITNTKFYRDNPFTSWYVSKKVAELPLFDINKVPKAITNIQMNVEK